MSFSIARFHQACDVAREAIREANTGLESLIDLLYRQIRNCFSETAVMKVLSEKVTRTIDDLGPIGYRLLHDSGYDLGLSTHRYSPGIVRLLYMENDEVKIIQILSMIESFPSKIALFNAFKYAVLNAKYQAADYIYNIRPFNIRELKEERKVGTLKSKSIQNLASIKHPSYSGHADPFKDKQSILSEFLSADSCTYTGIKYILDKGYKIISADFSEISSQLTLYHDMPERRTMILSILDLLYERAKLEEMTIVVVYGHYVGETPHEYRLKVLLRLMEGGATVEVQNCPPYIARILNRIACIRAVFQSDRLPPDIVRHLGKHYL